MAFHLFHLWGPRGWVFFVCVALYHSKCASINVCVCVYVGIKRQHPNKETRAIVDSDINCISSPLSLDSDFGGDWPKGSSGRHHRCSSLGRYARSSPLKSFQFLAFCFPFPMLFYRSSTHSKIASNSCWRRHVSHATVAVGMDFPSRVLNYNCSFFLFPLHWNRTAMVGRHRHTYTHLTKRPRAGLDKETCCGGP